MENERKIDFYELNKQILPPDGSAMEQCKAHWDTIAKPLEGLGEMEKICARIAGLSGSPAVSVKKRAVVIFCADNGVVSEGVTQTDASVTATMASMMAQKRSSVCVMAASVGADVFPVDMGMLRRVPGVRDLHMADGTADIAIGPAMTRNEAIQCVEAGISLAREYKEQNYELLATGEMGIGNTTTSAAAASVLLGIPAAEAVGRGAGLSDEGLVRKQTVVQQAIEVNRPNPQDALDVLHKVGGFDIAGMAGLFLGCALYRIPVIIDGVISLTAALAASMLCPNSICAMIASHCPAEPAAGKILDKLGLTPLLHAGFKLGEGTGAVCMMPLIDLALSVYDNAVTFSDTGIAQYVPQGEKKI